MFNTNDMHRPRLLAVVALVVCGMAFLAVVITSGGSDGSEGSSDEPAQTQKAASGKRQTSNAADRAASQRGTYTVKSGDTLAGIAEKVNVPVEKLQQLNPDLDPQALVSGQRIKLRE